MTLHGTPLDHQMPVLGGQLTWGYTLSENMRMSRWPDIVLLLATRSLYQGSQLIWWYSSSKNMRMSRWPYVVLLLATRFLYRGAVRLRVNFVGKYELASKFTLASQRSFLRKDQLGYVRKIAHGKTLSKQSITVQVTGASRKSNEKKKVVSHVFSVNSY